jgi:DNA (cytosine-5)-methyltransferase 1
MRYLSVCSGMEAASVAWHPLGWTPVGFSEIEPFPCAILKHRFPNTPNYGSLTEYTSWPIEPGAIDLLVGGTPCQSFSVAGLRKGLTDPRGNLALTFLGLADKLKPRWIVWENVPGVLSSGGGRDFGSFLGALVELGYGFAYRVLDAQHFGVPQRRRRVFVVACLGDWRAAAEVLSLREGLRGYLETGNKKRKSPAADAGASVEAGGLCATGTRTHALTASQKGATEDGTGRGTPIVIDRAAFNQGENAKFDPHIAESEVMDSLIARGPHAVGVQPMAFSAKDSGADATIGISPTLRSQNSVDGNQNSSWSIAIIQPHIVQASELRLRGQITEQNTCPTLLANTKSGDNDPLAVQAVTFQPGNLRRDAGADPSTTTTTTLKASAGDQTPHIAYPVVPLDGMNLLSRLGPCGEEHSLQNFEPGDPSFTLKKGGNQHGVLTPMAVRRLTPVECERLQGFPDNWSRISWKGKPETECPDGPRYKACGNSMAVPVMRWIGERIAAVDSTLPPHA